MGNEQSRDSALNFKVGEAFVNSLLGPTVLRVRVLDSSTVSAEAGHVEVSVHSGPPAADATMRVVSLAEAKSTDTWRAVAGGHRDVLLDLLGAPRLVRRVEMASMISALAGAVPDQRLGLLLAPQVLELLAQVELKRFLADRCAVEWITWFDLAFASSPCAFIVVGPVSTRTTLRRLVDARGISVAEGRKLIDFCRVRRGGDGERERVRRGPLPMDRPWTWSALSRAAEDEEQDILELGVARPLSEVARLRILRPGRFSVTELDDPEELPDDRVGLVQGNSIDHDGLLGLPYRAIPKTEVDQRHWLAHGDVLVASVFHERLRVGVVPQGYPPSVAHGSVLQLRFHDELGAVEQRAVVAYLRSSRYARKLSEHTGSLGGARRATGAALEKIGVPRFGQRLLEALDRSASARNQFSEWSREIQEAESSFFDAKSFRAELPVFLSRSRLAADQVVAAADVGTLEGRIRQRFPHPLALRYETIAQMDHGPERVRATLECAEHVVLFLALLGLANLGGGPTASLQAWTEERGGLSLDWGRADSLLREAASKSSKSASPLASPIPEFERLSVALGDQNSALNRALGELRGWRNDESHLTRNAADEIGTASVRFAAHLKTIFDAASFTTEVPMVSVDDYVWDALSDERRARFVHLVGVSAAFTRSWSVVERELPRSHVGVKDVHARFHSLHPWLIRRTCGKCKHAETFVLSKFDSEMAKYVAMESGHPLVDGDLARALNTFVSKNRNETAAG